MENNVDKSSPLTEETKQQLKVFFIKSVIALIVLILSFFLPNILHWIGDVVLEVKRIQKFTNT